MADGPSDTEQADAIREGNRPTLQLHVPEPHYRPGDAVDFGHVEVPEAGKQPRPDETCEPRETQGLCYDLVRVLGDDHKAHGAVGPEARCRYSAHHACAISR